MALFFLDCADFLDRWVRRFGEWFSWASMLLMGAIIVQIILRYAFDSGFVRLEELQWHLYGVLIMIGLSYGQVQNAHVRVDLFHHRFTPRTKAVIEILGIFFLILPFIVIVFLHSLDFVYDAWVHNESSPAPEGLPVRWVIKSMIPLGLGLLFLSVISRLFRELNSLLVPNRHGN